MKRAIRILTCAAVLGSAIFTGCEKNGFDINKGKAVSFSAVSSGAPTTKTSYGEDSGEYQIINWLANDLIRVYSDNAVHRYSQDEDQHWADYIIVGEGGRLEDGHKSVAKLTYKNLDNTSSDNYLESANGLVWGEAETYNFWAIYPSTGQNSDITIGEDGAVSATLLSTSAPSKNGTVTENNCTYSVYAPNMKYAYMTSVASVSGSAGEVNLDFNPAFTAFEIYLSSSADEADGGFFVNSLTLTATGSSDYLSGPFTMTAGDLSTATAAEGAQKSVSVTFSSAVEITPTTGLESSFFTMPITNTGAIVLQVATTEGTATLKFTKKNSSNAYEFEAGKKYRIHLLKLGGRWRIVFGGDDMDVEPWEQSSTSLIVE